MPSWAPRPVPTMSAVGVASPSAQGHAMTMTATAAVNAAVVVAPKASHPASVSTERAITTGTNTAETRSARRCTGALPALRLGDEAGDPGERGRRADPRRLDDEASRRIDRRANHMIAWADLDGHRLAGQHRLVDR